MILGMGVKSSICYLLDFIINRKKFLLILAILMLVPAGQSAFASTPSAVMDLSITVISETQVDLDWSIPDDGGSEIIGYSIDRQRNGVIETIETAFGDATSVSYSDTTLSSGDTVRYMIAAINAEGQGPFSNIPAVVSTTGGSGGATIPDTVPDCDVNVISGSQVDLSWSTPDDGGSEITGYKIQSKVNGILSTLETSYGDANSEAYSHTGLSSGDEVQYRIAAINAEGQADYSNVPPLVTTSGGGGGCGTTFCDVAASSGTDFHHHRNLSHLMPVATGIGIADINNDGLLDIYTTDSDGPNALFLNEGGMSFTDIAASAGVEDSSGEANGVCFGDYDNDGLKDFYLNNRYGFNKLFHNDDGLHFTDVTGAAGVSGDSDHFSTGCAWGDYNSDGYLDLLVGHHITEDPEGETNVEVGNRPLLLFTNDQDGTFTNDNDLLFDPDIPADPGEPGSNPIRGATFTPSFVDYDNDGDLDIYVVNDFGFELRPNALLRNDGDGPGGWEWTDVSESSGADTKAYGMGLGIGDFDRNGFFDFSFTNVGQNYLLSNNNGMFNNVGITAGIDRPTIYTGDVQVTWGSFFFDYNNDGWEDLYFVAGFLEPAEHNFDIQPNLLFLNDQNGATFTDVSAESGTDDDRYGRAGVYADFNNDGCLDIYLGNMGGDESTGTNRLFQNTCTNGNNWIIIKTVGTESNSDGIGARITSTSASGEQMREVRSGSTHHSNNMIPVHFGLGSDTQTDIEITWPSGTVQNVSFNSEEINQVQTVIEP